MLVRLLPFPLFLLFVAGCSSEPSATGAVWSLEREKNGKGYLFSASAKLLDGEDGWFSPQIQMTDERGCHHIELLSAIFPISAEDPSNVAGKF